MNHRLKIELDIPESKKEIAKTILLNVEEVINCVTIEHLEIIAKPPQKPKTSDSKKALAKKIADQDYREGTPMELWCLEFGNLLRLYRLRRRLLSKSIGIEEVMALLAIESASEVVAMIENHILLAVKDLGEYRFPLWQFEPEGKWGVIDDLPQVLAALQVSPFRKLNWLTKVHRAFEERTPIEMLLLGHLSEVIIEARAVGVCQ